MSLLVSCGKLSLGTPTVTVKGAEENGCRVNKNLVFWGERRRWAGCWSGVAIPGMLTLSHLDQATVARTRAWG